MKAKIIMLKNVLRFFGAGLGVVIIAICLISGIQYLRYRYSPEYKAYKQAEQILKDYENDPYGGDTPEKTLQLFIDALKKGDTDLASKYFVMEDWQKWSDYLKQIKDKNLLDNMLKDLERIELTKKDDNTTFFIVTNDENQVTTQLVMRKHQNNKWKIEEL